MQNKKSIKIAMIINEFFGGAQTGYGGYGFLARKLIAKHIPNKNIQIDVLIGKSDSYFSASKIKVDDVYLYRLPRKKFFAKRWMKAQKYDAYLSIELTAKYPLECADNSKKLIFWIQDPRPKYEWDEIATMTLMPEPNYFDQKIYDLVNKWYRNNSISFISQAKSLNQKAIDLYNLKQDVSIKYLPNPIEINHDFNLDEHPKKNMIIFLGRLEDVKRGWLFCEIAKKMPQYEFHVLGKANVNKTEDENFLAKYYTIPNLHFAGFVDGEKKEQYLKDAKILVNTSIHEALPVSFLEALAYGTLLVSNRNPDELTSKFGVWTGEVLGDGFDKVDLFVDAIEHIMSHEDKRQELATKAIEYIKEIHSIDKFKHDLTNVFYDNIK